MIKVRISNVQPSSSELFTRPSQYPGSLFLLSSQTDDLSATLPIAILSCDSLSLRPRHMIPSST
jgi:hypothetical protein